MYHAEIGIGIGNQQLRNVIFFYEFECLYSQHFFVQVLWILGHQVLSCDIGKIGMLLKHPSDVTICDNPQNLIAINNNYCTQTVLADFNDDIIYRSCGMYTRFRISYCKFSDFEVKAFA